MSNLQQQLNPLYIIGRRAGMFGLGTIVGYIGSQFIPKDIAYGIVLPILILYVAGLSLEIIITKESFFGGVNNNNSSS